MASNFEDTAQTDGFDYEAGTDIFGADGQRLGSLSEKGVQNGYLVVHHGTLLGKDAYVPLSQVVDTRQDGIYLNVAKDDLAQFDGSAAPQASPRNVGGAAGGDTWMYQGEGAPAASGQPINQPAPLRMRAPQRAGTGLGASNQFAQDTTTMDTTYANRTSGVPITESRGTQQGVEETRIPLAEEELIAGKRQTEGGRVGLHKDVVEEQKTVNVPITHEEVQIEHRPIEGGAVAADQIGQDVFQEKHIDVPVRQEEVVTGKRAQAKDEVRLTKTPVTENQEVTDTVRRERLRVDSDGVDVGGNNPHLADNLEEDQQATTRLP